MVEDKQKGEARGSEGEKVKESLIARLRIRLIRVVECE